MHECQLGRFCKIYRLSSSDTLSIIAKLTQVIPKILPPLDQSKVTTFDEKPQKIGEWSVTVTVMTSFQYLSGTKVSRVIMAVSEENKKGRRMLLKILTRIKMKE